MLDELTKKKKKGEMEPAHKEAKMAAVKQMRDIASSMLKDGLGKHLEGMKGMKKVTVAAPDKEGLKEGLEHAQDMMGGEDDEAEGADHTGAAMDEADEGHDMLAEHAHEGMDKYGHEEGEETPEEEAHEVEEMDMSLPEIEEMERILAEKKMALKGK